MKGGMLIIWEMTLVKITIKNNHMRHQYGYPELTRVWILKSIINIILYPYPRVYSQNWVTKGV